MDLYGQKDKSIPQKTVLIFLEIAVLAFSYWILFEGGYTKIFTGAVGVSGNKARHIIVFVFNCIVFLRILITMFRFMSRKMPWEEAFSIPFAFAVYYVGFAVLAYDSAKQINLLDVIGIILFITGSLINTLSEYLRDNWKKLPSSKGRLYTKGLFKYSMHINYFGDLLWVTGYAFVTNNWVSFFIPVLIFFFFAFFNIPKLDEHLAAKYKEEFDTYRQNTKKFIPFIY